MIRPSSLNIAQYCTLSPVLSEQYGRRTDESERGTEVDKAVTAVLKTPPGQITEMPKDRDALACLRWIQDNVLAKGWKIRVQERVQVFDPDTGGLITHGTPDIVATLNDVVWVIDLKKREQYWAGLLANIDDDLQTHAYALGAVAETGAFCYMKSFLLFGDGEVDVKTSRLFGADDLPGLYDKLKDMDSRPVRATTGEHCMRCYSREHCSAWLLPAYQGPSALEPFTKPEGLTKENAPLALDVVQAMKKAAEVAENLLKEYAKREGGIVVGDRRWACVQMPGRTSVNQAALEKDGLLEQYSKKGPPYESFRWLRAKVS